MFYLNFKVLSEYTIVLFIVLSTNGNLGSKQKHHSAGSGGLNNSIAAEPDWLNQFVSVNAKGEVRPLHLSSGDSKDVISTIPEKRIIGGENANNGDVPYQISMQYQSSHSCGGSIYNSYTVLTAAHCFYLRNCKWCRPVKMEDNDVKRLEFVAGEHDLLVVGETEQRTSAASVIIHPRYDPRTGANDIAIVKVKKPYVYNKYVQPLPIDYPPLVPEKVKWAWISGWGYTKAKYEPEDHNYMYYPSVLKIAQVEVFQRRECVDFYTKWFSWEMRGRLQNGAICAGERARQGATSAADTCQGDSGGPLACVNPAKHNLRFLCGIVSTGVGCGVPGLPGVYTRVANYQRWIIDQAGYADRRTFHL